jgi:hypothetical protein
LYRLKDGTTLEVGMPDDEVGREVVDGYDVDDGADKDRVMRRSISWRSPRTSWL